jgi:hypothetical protein
MGSIYEKEFVAVEDHATKIRETVLSRIVRQLGRF